MTSAASPPAPARAPAFAVGSLVRTRGREWVVLPDSRPEDELYVLRPLGGTDDEIAGVYRPLESIEPAEFPPPDPAKDLGSHLSCGLLREAVRLGFRSGAGPFRSLARIAVDPRPYQLVPLLMALRLDPVRLLIADDVGIGKTIEACLIARELLDRGEIQRMTVLCPPHLAEQWQRALRRDFHIDATLVLPGTAARLERGLYAGASIFEEHPFTVISMDYIKSERRRDVFLRTCPELVIVDEAHGCASATLGRAAQQRHAFLSEIVKRDDRHLILVTATPHSGKDEDFRSLLSLLDPAFGVLPDDLSGDDNKKHREALARHFVQRRRADLEAYLDVKTPFPARDMSEDTYALDPEYRRFLGRVLDWCKEMVEGAGDGDPRRRRVRWWSALALLRSISSSPDAAVATLENRAASADTTTPDEADAIGRRLVLDHDEEGQEAADVVPGSAADDGADAASDSPERRRLKELAREAAALRGAKDRKLTRAIQLVQDLVKDGFSPIVFCRFIPTVDYVAAALRKKLGEKVQVVGITGLSAPEEREKAIEDIDEDRPRVLVCTDCLSEGIDLQHLFDAVFHYDLCWNPTRHEQREGRVDRYAQRQPRVRTVTFYGKDNPVDGIILDVLLRKHKAIHKELGITVPVPLDTNAVVEAILEGLVLRGSKEQTSQLLFDFAEPSKREVEMRWNEAKDRHKRSRTIFAQRTIDASEVKHELEAVRRAIGDDGAIERFVTTALPALGATVSAAPPTSDGRPQPMTINPTGASLALKDAIQEEAPFRAAFDQKAQSRGALLLTRTHPVVAGLAAHVLEAALDPALSGPARRAGVMRTRAVEKRTTLLLLRLRFHIVAPGKDGVDRKILAEDQLLLGFRGAPDKAEWIGGEMLDPIVAAAPEGNIAPELAQDQLRQILAKVDALRPALDEAVRQRGADLLDAHKRVRRATKQAIRALRVEPHLPADILGLFVYLPLTEGAAK